MRIRPLFRSLALAGLMLAMVASIAAAQTAPVPPNSRPTAHRSIAIRPGDVVRREAREPDSPAGATSTSPNHTPNMPSHAVGAGDGSGDVFVATYTTVDSGVDRLMLHRIGPDGERRWSAAGVAAGRSVWTYALVADGRGGLYVAWTTPELGANGRVWLQHVDAAGARTCGPDGFLVDPRAQWQDLLSLSPDGSGGVVIAWSRWVPDTNSTEMAMRYDATGSPLWTAPLVPDGAGLERIVSDGAGGAFLVYESMFFPEGYIAFELRIQRVGPDLVTRWSTGGIHFGDGFAIPCLGTFPDGQGGIVLGWLDVQLHAHAQHLAADGTPLWGADGVESTAPRFPDDWRYGNLEGVLPSLEILPDGQGGVCFAQVSSLPTTMTGPPLRMIAQRIGADGAVRWPESGVYVRDDVISEPWYLCSNPDGGLDVLWRETGGPRFDVRVQRIGGDGMARWGPRGRLACDHQEWARPMPPEPTGDGGLLVGWDDQRAFARPAHLYRADLYAQRFDASGMARWATGGLCLSAAWIGQLKPSIVRSGDGVMLVWDEREGTDLRVFARAFARDGTPRAPRWRAGDVPGPQREPTAVSDGAGGAFVAWEQVGPETTDLRAQHLTADGERAWGADGVLVRRGIQQCLSPAVIADSAGGSYVAWVEDEASVRVQRLDAAGQPRWAAEGVVVSGSEGSLQCPALALDGLGGVLAGWFERPGYAAFHTSLQRLDGDGRASWTAGGVTSWPTYFFGSVLPRPRFASDGAGGAYVMATSYSVQHLDALGQPTWAGNGVGVVVNFDQGPAPDLAVDPAGDLHVSWTEYRDGPDRASLFTQRIDLNGDTYWVPTGSLLASGVPPDVQVFALPDSTCGALEVWVAAGVDRASPRGSPAVGARSVSRRGIATWPDVVALCDPDAVAFRGDVIPDGEGGAFAAWEEIEGVGGRRVRVQHLTADGGVAWGTGGFVPDPATLTRARASAQRAHLEWRIAGEATDPRAERRTVDGEWTACGAVTVGDSGLVTLDDAVAPGTRYAYRLVVTIGGVPTTSEITWIETPPLAALLTGVRPSPARGPFAVSFALAEGAPATLELFDIAGRRVDEWPLAGFAPGRHTLTLGDVRPLRPGLYVLRLAQGGHAETRRVVVLW